MKFWSLLVLASGVVYGVAESGYPWTAQAGGRPELQETRLTTRGGTEAPIGHIHFCRRLPHECRAIPVDEVEIEVRLTKQRLDELMRINESVNRRIKPVSDEIQYKQIEYWTYPTSGKGDCEDYVLLKKRELVALGWPASALLITVVRDENDEGHAVLMARTDHGDLVLDNKHSELKDWQRTPYTYIKRQSAADPRQWEALVPQIGSPTVAASGENAPSR